MDRPGGQSVVYSYYNNAGDERLRQIQNLGPSSAVMSQFNYTYNAVGDILTWTQQADAANPQGLTLGYDAADQLRSANLADKVTNAVLKQYAYNYDAAGNRLGEQIDNSVAGASYNNLNQLTSFSSGGPLTLEGTLNEPATVTVGGNSVAVDSDHKFKATVSAVPGPTAIPIVATDGNGNVTSKTANLTVTGGTAHSLSYDLNGNLTDDGSKTYEWDAANRLLAINYTGTSNRTEFAYDGQGRRVQIVERTGTTVTSTKKFIWIGNTPVEERDGGNNVTRRFYSEGEQIGSNSYYFTKDHLGSIREITDATGAVQTRYSYDPWGRRSTASYKPTPVSGTKVQRSEIIAGDHQHYFQGATSTLSLATGDTLVCWVYLDPAHLPREIMFQWNVGGSWEHRAYWGENLLPYGGSNYNYMGALPAPGGWVRLTVPASTVGLVGQQVNGMSFSLYDGRVWWDAAGKRASGASSDTVWVDDALPAGATGYTGGGDTWSWVKQSVDSDFGFTGDYYHAPSTLNLTLYRAYDANSGRWLSRDPLGERGGINLYGYVANSPINAVDLLGLEGTWNFSVADSDSVFDPPVIDVSYTMSSEEHKCCYSVAVHRLAWDNLYRNGVDDGTGQTSPESQKVIYLAHALPDQPGWFRGHFSLPWKYRFKWEAICKSGPSAGKILSTATKEYKASWYSGSLY